VSVSLVVFQEGAATADLGGVSMSHSQGLRYKIDDGEWKVAVNSADHFPCQMVCGEDGDPYEIPELNNNKVEKFPCTNCRRDIH
jgi:hypothetical protein